MSFVASVSGTTHVPSFAASPCSDTYAYAVSWNDTSKTTYTPPPAPTGAGLKTGMASAIAPAGSGASDLGVKVESTTVGTVNRTASNLSLNTGPNVAGTGGGIMLLDHSNISTGRGNRQVLTITFDRPVTDLSFSIADIDSLTNNWYDQVEISGFTGATPAAAVAYTQSPVATNTNNNVNVWGDGSENFPWRPRTNNLNVPSGSAGTRP